ncbi:MAG: glycosyltransferase [Rhizobiales bacterium]|nr:glycosyltransferase [Hyphomicrobiales bacterium]
MAGPDRLLYLVTEDWYFVSHRLPMARAARDAGFEVHVATRVRDHGEAIRNEGFHLHPLHWSRGSLSPVGNLVAVRRVRALLARLGPAILHNVAMKPALIGSLASLGRPSIMVVNSVAGLGSLFLSRSARRRAVAGLYRQAVRHLMARANTRIVVQNPDDEAVFHALGVPAGQVVLIPGSGVDTERLVALAEPEGPIVAAFVGRMLEDKGVRALITAQRLLRERGRAPQLLLAGRPDPENPTSIPEHELAAWDTEPDITWLGHVNDIAGLWARAHIALLPSRREGLPKSLLEAAACGRAMVASDTTGCREVAIEGETALTHGIDDAEAIARAIERLAGDGALRARLAANARKLAEERFSARAIGEHTAALYASLLEQRRRERHAERA